MVGDYDGDGKSDIAVYRPGTVGFYVIPSSNPGAAYFKQFGHSGDIPVPRDYDADGITDLATFTNGTNCTWNILPSTSLVAYTQSWGLAGDKPTQADFDGDGKTDFAIWRPSSGNWYVIPSGNPNHPYYEGWGQPGDVPVFPAPMAGDPPFVRVKNLTRPQFSPNFAVGDVYQTTVTGPPNQPVYRSQAWNGNSNHAQVGSTDSTGHFVTSGTQSTATIGTYTEVWSVGSAQASPTVSYIVAQSGSGTGWVATGESGQTSDGHLTGFSYMSITGGSSIYTYSDTALDYIAQANYDAYAVATLYQNGGVLQQKAASSSSLAAASFNATATAWDDYTLQTDHYVVAFIPISGDYYNPFYYGDGSCDDASSDCSIGLGSGPLYVIAELIYVGSTVADQTAVPSNPILPLSIPSQISSSPEMILKIAFISVATVAAIKEAAAIGTIADPPIPAFLDLLPPPTGDSYQKWPKAAGGYARERNYVVRDVYGRPWPSTSPLLIRENFDQLSVLGTLPDASGEWASKASIPSFPSAQQIDQYHGTMLDTLGFSGVFAIQYNQYFSASNFNVPSWWNFSPRQVADWPLVILDTYNTCIHGKSQSQISPGVTAPLPGQTIYLTPTGVGVDGDTGPLPLHSGCGYPALPYH